MSCNNTSPVRYSWIGDVNWGLRHRTGYDGSGNGIHGGEPHSEEFNSTFKSQTNNWILNTNHYTYYYGGGKFVDWVGEVGVMVCKSGMHGYGRAFDLTSIRYTNGQWFDTNTDWRNYGLYWQRHYLAVVASLRRHFGTVLTCWYNTAHYDHIHFDSGTSVGPINSGLKSDTTLVQAACKYLNGANITIDGVWGSGTNAAYANLLRAFDMYCYNPRGNTDHAKLFLEYVMLHGFGSYTAGAYSAGCSPG